MLLTKSQNAISEPASIDIVNLKQHASQRVWRSKRFIKFTVWHVDQM